MFEVTIKEFCLKIRIGSLLWKREISKPFPVNRRLIHLTIYLPECLRKMQENEKRKNMTGALVRNRLNTLCLKCF